MSGPTVLAALPPVAIGATVPDAILALRRDLPERVVLPHEDRAPAPGVSTAAGDRVY